MTYLPKTEKRLALFLILLAVLLVGHDIYWWFSAGSGGFGFLDGGSLLQHYANKWLLWLVDHLGPETFNAVLTPVLALPAFILPLACAGVTALLGYLRHKYGSPAQAEKRIGFTRIDTNRFPRRAKTKDKR